MKRIIIILLFILPLVEVQTTIAATKRALLIGISDYGNAKEAPNKWANINGANDISLLSPLFKKQGFLVTTLTDQQASYLGIIKALNNLIKNSKKGDIVYIHFSMHGQPFEDLNGDERDGWDESLIPIDAQMQYKKGVYEGKNHLLDDELEKYFNDIRSKLGPGGNLYVVLDACHSGGGVKGFEDHIRGTNKGFTFTGKRYRPNRLREDNDYFKIKTKPGQSPIICLEACRSYQVNNEVKDAKTNMWYGSLSYYIAQAMKNNKSVGSDAWVEYVKNGMSNNKRLRKQNMVIEKSK